jgi:DNA-binding MarR family transcriptional regulator
MNSPNQPAIPQDSSLNQILKAISNIYPEYDTEIIRTNLVILDFAKTVMSAVEAHFARYDLSQARFAILMLLSTDTEQLWTPAKLADALGITKATITGLLDVLEKGDFIERKPNPNDRRSSQVVMTKNGRTRLRNLLPEHLDQLLPLVSVLKEEERQTLSDFLFRLKPIFEDSIRDDK